jgi:dTMP kinase
VAEVIRPALQEGKLVVADRYLLANVVYQGYGGGLDVPTLWEVGRIATGGLMPSLTIVLDLPAEVAARRIDRDPDRMEMRGLEYHRRVREGFLAEALKESGRIVVVDASRPIEAVQEDMRLAARRVLDRIAYEQFDYGVEESE